MSPLLGSAPRSSAGDCGSPCLGFQPEVLTPGRDDARPVSRVEPGALEKMRLYTTAMISLGEDKSWSAEGAAPAPVLSEAEGLGESEGYSPPKTRFSSPRF